MNQLLSFEGDASWDLIAPQIDDALSELSEPDREALMLRYFKNHDFRTVGSLLGISDDAAQKRVSRAVERLREFFARRGVAIGAGGLAVVISAHAVKAAPAGLAVTISGAAMASAAGTGTTLTFLKIMAMTKVQLSVTGLIIAGATLSLIVQHRNQVVLREQNNSLRQQIEQLENNSLSERSARFRGSPVPHLPAPAIPPTASSASPTENISSSNLLARLSKNQPHLSSEQAEKFLEDNHRSASSLLAVYRTTANSAYLDEAMGKFPGDPQVAFEAALRTGVAPEEKRRWLDALKKSAPENSFANYLSALDYFNSGQTDQAVQELIAASDKSRFNDYYAERSQANAEALESAGYSEVESLVATAMGPEGLDQPQLKALKDLCARMVELANSYRQAGDETSAQAALQMAVSLGENFDGSKGAANRPPTTRATAFAIEYRALQSMDPAAPFGSGGGTVKDQLDRIAQQKAGITELCNQLDALYPKATPQDMINFLDRARLFGDESAMQWLTQKYGGQ